MKVYTKVVMDWDGNVIEEESYDYDGPVAQCGGGSKSSPSSTTTVQKADPWAGVQPFLKQGYQDASSMYEQGTLGGPSYYPGQTFVDRDPLENQAQLERLGYSLGPMRGQVGDLMGAQQRMLNADQVYGNPAVEGQIDVVQRRLNRNLTENTLPGLRSGSIAAGQLGGSRQALGQAGAVAANQEALGDAAAQIYGKAYDAGLQQQARGVGFMPQSMQTAMMPYDTMGQVGAYRRGEAEAALEDSINRYNYEGQRPIQNLNNYMQLLQGAPWGSTSTGQMAGGGRSGFSGGGAMGGALTGAQLGSMFGPIGTGIGAIGGGLLGGLF
jgi:hypothetical protein